VQLFCVRDCSTAVGVVVWVTSRTTMERTAEVRKARPLSKVSRLAYQMFGERPSYVGNAFRSSDTLHIGFILSLDIANEFVFKGINKGEP